MSALGAVLASACSDSSDGGGGGGGGCKDFAGDVCNKIESCYPFLIDLAYGDVAKCVERTELGCNEQIGAPGSSLNSTGIASCGNRWAGASCNELLTANFDECDVPGTLADGEPCQFDTQCLNQNCRYAADTACGTCGARAAAGGTCNVDGDCQDGLVCSNNVCATPVAAGGACTGGEQCAANLICKGGTCAMPDAAGAACSQGTCDILAGLYCDPASSTCKTAQIAQAGASCGLVSGTFVVCAAQGTCNGATATTPGTCAAASADGGTCSNTDAGPNCLAPAECIGGSCQLPNPGSCT